MGEQLSIIMKVVLTFAFFLAASQIPEIEAGPSCPNGWRIFFKEKLCYKYFPGNRSYYSAKSLCKRQSGNKAEIAVASNIGRNNFIAFVHTNKNLWLGGRRVHEVGHGMMDLVGPTLTGGQMNQIILMTEKIALSPTGLTNLGAHGMMLPAIM